MGRFIPVTSNGYNMYDMASLMQKAIRRGDIERAGFAANEMYEKFRGAMWNRLMIIASEDCFGVLNKELVPLRERDDEFHDKGQVSKAIDLLCRARKSRDACYFANNFVLTQNCTDDIEITSDDIRRWKIMLERIPKTVFSRKAINNKTGQTSLFEVQETRNPYYSTALLEKAVQNLDMENIGTAIRNLRNDGRNLLWRALLIIGVNMCGDRLTDEIIALQKTDARVNGSRKTTDEIFLSKAAMLLCYERSSLVKSLLPLEEIPLTGTINWNGRYVKPIEECRLPDGKVPDWTYDVHTLKGKRAGKTEWEMIVTEIAALNPCQPAFFEEGSWAPRYDSKYKDNKCTEWERKACLEYRKTRRGNPVEQIHGESMRCNASEIHDELSRRIYEAVNQ